jgi:hypothetical protein
MILMAILMEILMMEGGERDTPPYNECLGEVRRGEASLAGRQKCK